MNRAQAAASVGQGRHLHIAVCRAITGMECTPGELKALHVPHLHSSASQWPPVCESSAPRFPLRQNTALI